MSHKVLSVKFAISFRIRNAILQQKLSIPTWTESAKHKQEQQSWTKIVNEFPPITQSRDLPLNQITHKMVSVHVP